MVDIDYFRKRQQLIELRYNPYHDPSNGRFTSGGGGGGGMLVVPKGQKGKGFYVAPDTLDKGEQALANGEYDKWVKSRQPKQLDEALIKRVNATNSLFYNAGDAVKRNYNAELNEIGTMNLTDVEKKTASQKIYDYSVAELQARQKVYGVDITGPARGVSGSDKAFDKVLNIRNEHAGYMQSLRDTSKKRTMQAKKKEETDAAEKAIAKAMSNGDLEITINGKVYSRTNKKSGTWREGSVADNKAYKAFQKSQKSLPIAKHRSWDSLSAEEKQVYYTKN